MIREFGLTNVIEVGCGLGKTANIINLQCHNTKITGLDVSKTAISKARKSYSDIEFIEGSINDINEEWKKYDGFIFSDILWYILQDLNDIIFKLKNCCSEKTLLIKQIFYKGQQQYGREYFTSQDELIKYFSDFELLAKCECNLERNDTIDTVTVFRI